MRLTATALEGCVVVELEPHHDGRGWFARTFDAQLWSKAGLDANVVQCSASFNARRGTLRGMHFQRPPFGEAKLVRCTRGAIFDVAVDVRPASPTAGRWFATELAEDSERSLFIGEGFAHGFLTLTDDTEIAYQISTAYEADAAAGFHWDDPAVGIEWPFAPIALTQWDRELPPLAAVLDELRDAGAWSR